MTARDLELPSATGTLPHEGRYRDIVEHMPQIVSLANADGENEYYNHQWYAYTGLDPEADFPDSWMAIVHAEDRETIDRAWTAARRAGSVFEAEYRLRRADGVFRWHLGRSVPIKDAAGAIVRWVGSATDIDDRKRADAQVVESENRFRMMADTAPVMIWMTGVDARCGYVNKVWLGFTGRTFTQELGDGWTAGIHPDDRERSLGASHDAFVTRRDFTTEYRLRRFDGVYCWVISRGTPRFASDGAFLGFIGSCTDIDAQKHGEERARFVATLTQNVADAVISTDPAFRIVTWNRGAETMYGWTAAEVLGQSSLKVLPTEYLTGTVATLYEALATGGEWRGEVLQPRRSGEKLAVLSTLTRVEDDAGRVIGYTAINRDITERRRTEDNLRFLAEASKALASSLDYRTTLTTVAELGVPTIADWCAVEMQADDGSIQQVAVAHVDPEKVEWARALNAASPPDPNGPTGTPHVLRTGQSEFYPEITDAMLVATARDADELALTRKIGFTSVIVAPMRVGERTIGAITFVSAESGRHYTPVDLAMAEEVGARAALAVENARLYTASQRALNIRDDFISLASHELKTPVTSLKMYTQTLERQFTRRGETVIAERLRKMDVQVDKLTGLINDLLDVTRIDQGRLALREAEYTLDAVAFEAVEQIQATTRKHTIRLEGAVTTPLWGDRERVGQVLTNLLSNAVKYSPHAHEIIVRLGETPTGAQVSVQDFGIGIDAAHQQEIFTQFYRVSDPEEKTFPGLGLGLFIAHDIVQRHGGTIRVESAKGAGATFHVMFPRARAPETPRDV